MVVEARVLVAFKVVADLARYVDNVRDALLLQHLLLVPRTHGTAKWGHPLTSRTVFKTPIHPSNTVRACVRGKEGAVQKTKTERGPGV